jgi:hypothetical protein
MPASHEEIEHYAQCLLRQNQRGGGRPWESGVVFRGRRGQRGFGFGSLFSSIGRAALPVLKSLGKHALKGALDVGKSIFIDKKKPSEVLKSKGKEILSNVFAEQTGQGRIRRKRPKRQSSPRPSLNADIFDQPWMSTKRRRKA